MSGRKVYSAIAAITGELARTGVEKSHVNEDDGYRFRRIDDILSALSPLLARYKLCILPRVLDRVSLERHTTSADLTSSVSLRVAFDIVSAVDSSMHTVEMWGEAIDASDKATSKALTACYKQAVLKLFCIPVAGVPDADGRSPRSPRSQSRAAPPVQGWEHWVGDVTDLIESCQTEGAVARVQQTYRDELLLLSRAEPWLYRRIGALFTERKRQLTNKVVEVEPEDGSVLHRASSFSEGVSEEAGYVSTAQAT